MTRQFVNILKLNKLTNTAKEGIYNKLLKGDYVAEVTFCNYAYTKDIDVDVLFYDNDCCVSSWGLNFYRRTPKAVKRERYNTFGQCITALKGLLREYPCAKGNLRIYSKGSYVRGTRKHLFNIEL